MGGAPTKEEIIAKLDKLDKEERELNKKMKQIQIDLNTHLLPEDRVFVKDDLNESDPEEEEKGQNKASSKNPMISNKDNELDSSNSRVQSIDESNSGVNKSNSNQKELFDSHQEEHEIMDSDENHGSIHDSSSEEKDIDLSNDNVNQSSGSDLDNMPNASINSRQKKTSTKKNKKQTKKK